MKRVSRVIICDVPSNFDYDSILKHIKKPYDRQLIQNMKMKVIMNSKYESEKSKDIIVEVPYKNMNYI